MQFLYPSLLWALSLIAIPIIIHLFNFQRPKKVLFTNVSFLREAQQLSRSRNRLRHILILLARIAFIVLLVMAFAQPFFPSKKKRNSHSGAEKVAIYLDNSFSLQNEQDNKRLLDLGATYAQQIPSLFSNAATFQLTDNSFEGGDRFFYTSSRITDQLSTIDFSALPRELSNIERRQNEALKEVQNGNIFWISDFQRTTTPDWQSLSFDSTHNYYLVPIQPNQRANISVDSVWLERPFVQPDVVQKLFVKIKNRTNTAATDKTVQLFMENKQVSTASLDLPANSSKTIELNFSVRQSQKAVSAKVSIEDYPILFDNDYYFAIIVAPQINILSIYEKQNEAQDYLEKVFTNTPFFNYTSSSLKDLNDNNIQEADLIILEGLTEIETSLQATLRQVLRRGAHVLVFPSSTSSKVESFNSALGLSLRKLNSSVGLSLLPPSENDPFYEGVFEKISSTMSTPVATAVWTGLSSGQSLLKFRNGQSFLMRQPSSTGTVFVSAAPLTSDKSAFGTHALFVPTMYKIALSSLSQADRLAYSLEEQIAVLTLDSLQKNTVFEMLPYPKKKNDQALIPAQRVVGNKLIIELPRSDTKAGVYQLIDRKSKKVAALLAFNYSRAESDLSFFAVEELEQVANMHPNVQIYRNKDTAGFVKEFRENNQTTPLWRYFLVFALVMILIEIGLSRISYKRT